MQCASIFGNTALNSSERNAIFLQRGWRHNGDLHFFSKVHDRDRYSFPAKKNTQPPPVTSCGVRKFRRRSLNGTHISTGVLRGSASLSSTLVVVSSCSARDLLALCRDGVSTFTDQPRWRAHYFRLEEPRTLLPMLMMVAMFVGFFSLRLSHEAGSSRATLSLLNLQTGMNGDMWASLLRPKPSSTRLRCSHTNVQWMDACDDFS